MKNYRKIAVTGGGGFVGSELVCVLLAAGYEVIIIGRKLANNRGVIPRGRVKFIFCSDVFGQSISWWSQTLKGVDLLVHCAWYTAHRDYLNSSINFKCLSGSIRMMEGAVLAKVPKIIGLGSCAEYAFPESNENLLIDSPLAPRDNYSFTKVALQHYLKEMAAVYPLSYAWCRLFFLSGEGQDEARLIPYIRRQIKSGLPILLREKNVKRDYIDVADAARKILKIIELPDGGCFNICSGVPVSLEQLVAKEAKKLDLPYSITYGNVHLSGSPKYIVGVPSL